VVDLLLRQGRFNGRNRAIPPIARAAAARLKFGDSVELVRNDYSLTNGGRSGASNRRSPIYALSSVTTGRPTRSTPRRSTAISRTGATSGIDKAPAPRTPRLTGNSPH
jgi:hypothetical protein